VSTYPTAQAQGGYNTAAAAPSKPGTLMAAIVVAVLAGLAAVVNGVTMLAGGAELAKDVMAEGLADIAGVTVEEVRATMGDTLGLGLDELQGRIEFKAYIVLVFGAALLLFGVFMRNAATWARVMVTISAVLAAGFSTVIAADVVTPMMKGLGWAAVVGGLLAIVLTWLPANGRYAKAVKKA
jgi:hypothetical protein